MGDYKKMKTSKFIILAVFCSMLFLFLNLNLALAATYDSPAYEMNYSSAPTTNSQSPNLIVTVLKYAPYPVNSGDWFDLWIKVQNIGEQDAAHAVFELQPEYPFSSSDVLIRDYGLLFGKTNALKVDQTYDSSQVILKYRVKAADNAPSGTSNIKFITKTNGNLSSGVVNNLPIEIFSTKQQTIDSTVVQDNSSLKWVYGAIGFICGLFLIIFISILRSKFKASKSHS